MRKPMILLIGLVMFTGPLAAQEITIEKKPWHVLGFFDGENAELERVCEYNINQLEQIDSAYAKIVVAFDRTYKRSRDSSVRIYDIGYDPNTQNIISNSISIGERDMGEAEVLDEFLSKYLGERNVLIIKAHGYGIVTPPALKIGYNSNQSPFIISDVLKKRMNRPLDVLIFDSCNMATVEVAYEFKDLVDVMVASQDLMYYSMDITGAKPYSSRPGIDYINLVLKLKAHSNPSTIGKDVVASFTNIVSKKDALYNKATISALDLQHLDINVFKTISDELVRGLMDSETRSRYMGALENTLTVAARFEPIGRNSVLTHYDVEDFITILENSLGKRFNRPPSCVIQSYSNNYVQKATGLSILFFKDLSGISQVRKNDLFEQYSRSKFARETRWDTLIQTYHSYVAKQASN
jgi:hypothetical protein